jgi:hypothetical protein
MLAWPRTKAAINYNLMQRQRFQHTSVLMILLSIVISSCTGKKQDDYIAQLKKRLPEYDSITSMLISKYADYSSGYRTAVFPTKGKTHGDGFKILDSSITDFCEENNVSYIELDHSAKKSTNVIYYLLDNNYQYVYHGYDTSGLEMFENTRVKIVPINERWTFQYEKPNF